MFENAEDARIFLAAWAEDVSDEQLVRMSDAQAVRAAEERY